MQTHLGVHLISLLTGYRASCRLKQLEVQGLELLAEDSYIQELLLQRIELKHSKSILRHA